MTPETLARLQSAIAARQPIALCTRLADGAQLLLPDEAASPSHGVPASPPHGVPASPPHGVPADAALAAAAAAALAADKPARHEGWFIHPHNPPPRLIIVGAVHAAQAMLPMAVALGFATIVIDPRRAFATAERLPGVSISHDWPDEAMATLKPDTRSAIVTLTHDPKIDDPALDAALRSPAFYIGALGSRRTHASRVERLKEMGHSEAAIARINAPIGLDIKALTAPEIGLSIMAEIIAARRGAPLARRA